MSTPNHKARLVMELRGAGVTDTRVLSAIERAPREIFVPSPFVDQAYASSPLPIGHGQTLSAPSVVGMMTQALETGPRLKVLEVGTGSGYQTVVLSRLCRRVYTIERHRPLLDDAEARFATLRLHNITTRHGDGGLGWPEQAPFDRIIVTAAASEPPETLLGQLAVGGVMVIPIGGRGDDQRLLRFKKEEHGVVSTDLGAVRFVPLVGGALPERPGNN
ncbi:MAG: protein-L-isoaspartate(D-aspartate) O-methyltransferase [Rhodospirillaceae bacterium]|nr:protein-L-isoaspartate(D-aspartate) O-methyltransferase [Rhodospirillaceae bacterium]